MVPGTNHVTPTEEILQTKILSTVSRKGMTLLEILVAVAIIAILAGIAIPAYSKYIEKGRVSTAIADIKNLEVDINSFYSNNLRYPQNLGEINKAGLRDPWGNPYEYLNIAEADTSGKGKLRKDKNLVPINSDFDLYSMGPDGESVSPLTAQKSQDDIIRANNGAYVGPASGY